MESTYHLPLTNNTPLPSPSAANLPPMSLILQSYSPTAYTHAPPATLSLRHNIPPSRSRSTSSSSHADYDIAKIHAFNCTIIEGAVYNSAGHVICAVSNRHDRPCMRVGKCPFHHPKPVSSANSTNGMLDATGTSLSFSKPYREDTGNNINKGSHSLIPPRKRQYKRGWSMEEHYFFLQGLHIFGHGSWRKMEILVKSRGHTQIQSHAQKFLERQRKAVPTKKRSINDLTLESQEMIEMHRLFKDTELRSRLREIDTIERLQAFNCRQNIEICHALNEPGAAQSAQLSHQNNVGVAVQTTLNGDKRVFSAFDTASACKMGWGGYNQIEQDVYESTESPSGTHFITSSGGGISDLM